MQRERLEHLGDVLKARRSRERRGSFEDGPQAFRSYTQPFEVSSTKPFGLNRTRMLAG